MHQPVNGRPSSTILTDLYGLRGEDTLAGLLSMTGRVATWVNNATEKASTLKPEARWPYTKIGFSLFVYGGGGFVPGNSHQPHQSCP